jgi:hypothetical protein
MKNKIELTEALAHCLKALETHQMSMKECLEKYPQHRKELSPLLEKIDFVRSIPLEKPRTEFRKKGHQALLNAIKDSQLETLADRLRGMVQGLTFRRQRKFKPVVVIVAATLAFFVVTGGVAYASDDAAPGDLLYGLDRALEQVRLNLAADAEAAIALRLGFAEERLEEFEDRIAADDTDDAQAALESYGSEISALAELVAGPDGVDEIAKTELINAALTVHSDVLLRVLERVPEQAQEAIQKAIDKNNKFPGNQKEDIKPGNPDKPEKPEKPEKPDKPDKPENTGQPEDPGSNDPGEIP